MRVSVAFFEIPAVDFDRAVKFYGELFDTNFDLLECEHEKMACFPSDKGSSPGAISWTSAFEFEFKPSDHGTLISLNCQSITQCQKKIEKLGGKVLIPKTKIDAQNRGYFCVFLDSEGNRVGLYSER